MKKVRLLACILVFLTIMTGIVLASDKVINGDKILIFKDLRIPEEIELEGNIIAIFSDVIVDGSVDGEIVSIFGKVEVNGTIDGDVVSVLGNVDMGDKALVSRDMIQIAIGDDDRPTTSIVRGEEITIRLFRSEISGISAFIYFFLIFLILSNIFGFIISAILVATIPDRMNKITDATTVRIGRRLGIGILAVIIFYAAVVILGVIFIGVPLIPILGILMWLLGLGGNTAVKLAIGRRIGQKGEWSNITQLIVGSLIYTLMDITIILKPVLYLAKLVGMGAVIDTQIGTKEHWSWSKEKVIIDEETPAYEVVDKRTEMQEDIKAEGEEVNKKKEDENRDNNNNGKIE